MGRTRVLKQASGAPGQPGANGSQVLPTRTLTESELTLIEAHIQELTAQGLKPEDVSKTMGKWVRLTFGISAPSKAWLQYTRLMQKHNISKNGGSAAGGRRSYAETLPEFAKIVWTQHSLGTTIPGIQKVLQEKLKLKDEEVPADRTIRRFLEKNPVPQTFSAIAELEQSEEYQKWNNHMMTVRKVGRKQFEKLDYLIARIFMSLNKKNPKLWTLQDLKDYENQRVREVAGSSMRKEVNAIRSFAEHGLGHQEWLEQFGTHQYPKRSYSVINAFSYEGYCHLLKYMPSENYVLDFQTTKGSKVHREVDLSTPVARAEATSWVRLVTATGVRMGQLADTKEVIHSLITGDHSHMADHGSISIRVSDINYQGRRIKEVKDKFHKRPDKCWTDIPIPPGAYQGLKHYLSLRFANELREALAKQHDDKMLRMLSDIKDDAKFAEALPDETFVVLMRDLGQKLNEEYTRVYNQVFSEIKAIHSNPDISDHEKASQIKQLWNRQLDAFARVALYRQPTEWYNSAIYCSIDNAIKHNDPVTDNQDGSAWTPARVYDEKHVAHLLRKTFAQFLVNEGVPLEVIADYAVGWDDLTTLKEMYGKAPKKKLQETYEKFIAPNF